MMLSSCAALALTFLTIPFLTLAVAYHTVIRIRQREAGALRRRNCVLGLCTSVLSLWLLLLILELFFKAFVIQSDAFGHTLAAKRWFERYWGPTNSFGFRDQEFDTRILASSKTLFVIGDSFVAGLGVDNPEDRFSNHLRRWMGSDWCVLNFGRNGWDTRQEIDAVRSFHIQPNVIVWSYYLNDIAGAAAEHGRSKYVDLSISPSWASALVEHSYLVNFVYWRWFRVLSRLEGGPYWEGVQADFDNEAIWNTHRKELRDVVDYTHQHQIALLV
ncbi:MAG: SGNH/GDSL hydrolase family protein, partial [Nitrososphaera sp.]|nr:SGNH/GDSL hydrolase family protein [Nitrososphaera sp.]